MPFSQTFRGIGTTSLPIKNPRATLIRWQLPRHAQFSGDINQLCFRRRAAFLAYHQLHLQSQTQQLQQEQKWVMLLLGSASHVICLA
jgi:hypothetical protein